MNDTVDEGDLENAMFAGLVYIDVEGNLVPHAARSWEVLDEGRRYCFHLRDDLQWSDGSPLTAADFEWALKRNLGEFFGKRDETTVFDQITSARAYGLGNQLDPDLVGVHALDQLTLEVLLDSPAAFFLYKMADPQVFPLPRRVIERVGEGWWLPEHIVSNGPFRLVEFQLGKGYALERNPAYFGDFPGNLERVEFHVIPDPQESQALFRRGELDTLDLPARSPAPDLAPMQAKPHKGFQTYIVCLYPRPPLDDRRVRLALAHSLDRHALYGAQSTPGLGGYVPRGLAGHSPGICLPYDPELARRLMAEAGYPDGCGFPILTGACWFMDYGAVIANQWREALGIRVQFISYEDSRDYARFPREERNFHMMGMIDYPDPHFFLSFAFKFLMMRGWTEAPFEEYVERPAPIPDRARRMAMARRADRLLVAEQALIIPLAYGDVHWVHYLQPWVQGYRTSPQVITDYRQVRLLPH